MSNLFEKRATEYLNTDESFIAAVSPEPLTAYFSKHAREDKLFQRLVMIIGTPGSGKTFMARLMEFQTIMSLLKHRDIQAQKTLEAALVDCHIIQSGKPLVLGCRIPLESEYRDYWEFPYTESLKHGLLESMLQARTVLTWIRNIEIAGYSIEQINIKTRANAEAAVSNIGGLDSQAIVERAKEVELSIYNISASLLPPSQDDLPESAISAYRPFDVIEKFIIKTNEEQFGILELDPLVIFDDAHVLHQNQFNALITKLIKRELKISRWVMTRLDALSPEKVLQSEEDGTKILTELKSTQGDREFTEIKFQTSNDRALSRRTFRKMAKDIASRYLSQMDIFNERDIKRLDQLLETNSKQISESNLTELKREVNEIQAKYNISDDRRQELVETIQKYVKGSRNEDLSVDVQIAMECILLHRYINRVPQADLFSVHSDPEPSREIRADAGVANGARIQLLHKYDRPYYFGIDTLCDCGSENAEAFLRITSKLIDRVQTKIIRRQSPSLSVTEQHKLLRQGSNELVKKWVFPENDAVKSLIGYIAARCLNETLKPNAWLDSGANAYGILQNDFKDIPSKYPTLAKVLQYAVANNAINLVHDHKTKNRDWCLLELTGVSILRYGLTFSRGGFIEGNASDLIGLIEKK